MIILMMQSRIRSRVRIIILRRRPFGSL